MIISFTQLISLFFGVIVIAKTLTDYKKKKENWQLLAFWLVIWVSIIYIAFNPAIISITIEHFGNRKTTIGQIVGMGFVFVLYIVYRVYVKAHRLEKMFNDLNRKIALKDLKKSRRNGSK